ncbi:MAG: ABC transporter substrate-binding protein [Verrucomicrobia bacterium]|nr:ABC transporter substrate-binding protein [Verrucomicrobiota bacterium]
MTAFHPHRLRTGLDPGVFRSARAVWLLFLLLPVLLAGCGPGESKGGPAAQGETGGVPGGGPDAPVLSFIHDWVPEPEHGGYYAADRQGLWKAEGVAVRVLVGGPNSEIEKRVALDPFGLGIVRGDAVFVAVERGLPVVAVNAYFQHDPQGIMVREESPVKGFADLEDRDLAMQIGASWLLYLQKKYDLKRLRVRPVTGNVANFVRDPDWITQAYPTSEPYYALKEGVRSRVLQLSESGFDPYRVIIANRQLVEKHPDLVARFSRGAYRGWQEYFRNPQPIHDHLRSISPTMEDAGMRFSYVAMRRLRLAEGDPARGESLGAVDPERWRVLGDILKDLGVIRQVPPIDRVVSTAFTPRALGLDPALPPPFWTDAPLPAAPAAAAGR